MHHSIETFASILNVPMDHLIPQNTVDPSASGKTVDVLIAFF